MMDISPFSTQDAKAAKIQFLPKELIQAVNELLAERYKDHGDITMKLIDVKARCLKILGYDEMSSSDNPIDLWPNNVWDFEPVYRQQGWKVSYDRPGYNESYDGYYIFSQKKD